MTSAKFLYLVLGIEFDEAKRTGGVKHRTQTAQLEVTKVLLSQSEAFL